MLEQCLRLSGGSGFRLMGRGALALPHLFRDAIDAGEKTISVLKRRPLQDSFFKRALCGGAVPQEIEWTAVSAKGSPSEPMAPSAAPAERSGGESGMKGVTRGRRAALSRPQVGSGEDKRGAEGKAALETEPGLESDSEK